jgi:hypothetical protein
MTKLDRANLSAEEQSTANEWAEQIIADIKDHASKGTAKRYPNPKEHQARGGQLMDLPLPNGKTLGNCTFGELLIAAQAYFIVADHFEPKPDNRAPINKTPRPRPHRQK